MSHIIHGPYILRPRDRLYSVFLMIHTICHGPYILRPRDRVYSVDIFSKKTDRIFSALDRIFSADDRIFSAQDRIYSARTVYFTFQDRIFYYLIETGISVFISI